MTEDNVPVNVPVTDLPVDTALPAGTSVLVTGGGSGIGRAIAEAFVRAGARVAVAGRRLEVVRRTAEMLRSDGGETLALSGDVSKEADARRLVGETVEGFGALNVLVNNAGVARSGELETMSCEDVDLLVDIDLKGPIWMMRAALPHLRRHAETGHAAVVNVSSSVTLHPVPHFSVYSAAKAGLDMLTRCWARDYAADRIRVNAVNPGIVETPIFESMMPENAVDRVLRGFARETPLGRVGRPEEIARLTVFLGSPASAWMTGAVIPFDGGISLTS